MVGEELRRVDPRDRTPGWRVRSDEEVGAGDDGLGSGTADLDTGLFNAVHTAWAGIGAVSGQNAGVGEKPDGHEGRTGEESGAATDAVDPDQSRDGHDHVDDVLNGRGDKQGVAAQTGHGEDVGDVVHHNIHARKLRPDLSEQTNVGAVDVARSEELEEADSLALALELEPLLDLLEFTGNEGAVWVAMAVS